MTLTTHDVEQGTPEWLDVRRGIVTASTVGQLITPGTIKPANNPTSRGITATLVAERLTGHTEHMYISRDMERGMWDEPIARDHYSKHHAPAVEVGFMVREFGGHQLGYSPDGLAGDDGLIEFKSRRPKKHLETILADEVPIENMAQIQAGLLVSGREWCDYISWCGGLPMYVKRVTPDPKWETAILEALRLFEEAAETMTATYRAATNGLPPTERIDWFADEMEI